jgi:hypothetical protein
MVINQDPKKLAQWRSNLSSATAPEVGRPFAKPKEVA